MTDLITEVAELMPECTHTPPECHKEECGECISQSADEIIALINKRWQDWIEACGLKIDHYGSWGIDVLRTKTNEQLPLPMTFQPKLYDPNRFCPMSKEETNV